MKRNVFSKFYVDASALSVIAVYCNFFSKSCRKVLSLNRNVGVLLCLVYMATGICVFCGVQRTSRLHENERKSVPFNALVHVETFQFLI